MHGKKILIVVAPQKIIDKELLTPKKVFEDHETEVIRASTTKGPAIGMLGASVDPDLEVSQ